MNDSLKDRDHELTGSNIGHVVIASLLGTTIEWYDFLIYGLAAALVFNKQFFPTHDPFAGTLAAFGAYAVGFLARPVGGMIFGHLGDTMGRKATLVITMSLMGISTFSIGLLPTYEQVGIIAPILLIGLRLLQGVALGGGTIANHLFACGLGLEKKTQQRVLDALGSRRQTSVVSCTA